MTSIFKRIAIWGRVKEPSAQKVLRELLAFLAPQADIFLETETAEQASLIPETEEMPQENAFSMRNASFEKSRKINNIWQHDLSQSDLLIVIGGDGSLLQASRSAMQFNLPILGINLGKLGFLTDIYPHEMISALKTILAGKYQEETRFLLEASREKQTETHLALNEITLTAQDMAHMIEFEIYADNHFVASQRSNGMIIATPTGSTAYNLSAGGPILHPALNAVVLSPMFAHSLMQRPIVLSGNCQLKIILSNSLRTGVILNGDGQKATLLDSSEIISIKKCDRYLKLIHPNHYDYFEALRSKLYWGKKLPDHE